ncbi:Protein of unknown function [Prevotella communis]|uniref:VirE N-terminal domain-containing protein n=3 Tax=Prevotella communis TaxID=2913614 RepID=A0A1H0KGK7_9BACT|nr:DUF3987 domain-containing protein [Prevotella communis]SDO54832.1 Protein of unknown function [Prevotella communis]
MSVHFIYYKDGAKRMRPILTREEYLSLRNGGEQRRLVERIRAGEEGLKSKLVQMNYSCLPNEDGSLKGSKMMSTTVGMDIDHLTKEEMPTVRERILQKKEELGLLMLEESARGGGYHLVFRRRPELSQEENLKWASELLEVKYDDGAKDITRVFFTTTASAEDLLFLDDEIFERLTPSPSLLREGSGQTQGQKLSTPLPHREGKGESLESLPFPSSYHGIPFTDIIRKYWELNNHGFEPTIGDRDTLTYQLACDLRHICGKNADWLDQVIPCYNGFPVEEKRAKIKSALSSEYNGFPQRLRNVLSSLQTHPQLLPKWEEGLADEDDNEDAVANSSLFTLPSSLKRMPMGIRDSIDAVGPQLSMPVITAICPCIGTLATGVTLDVHGQKRGLNLIAYIAGDFASGKGGIDPVVEAWMSEVQALDKMYQVQEDEWRAKKRAAKNKKEQPEEPKLPVRCLTLNNTVANLAERLANTEGKHAFSFTPEADTVAQKWKSTMSDFSVMLRQSYDGTKYEREARSADAVNVHIDKLLWNVCMCGTPDALYRVVNNYTDGFQSRIAVARTPDNTFAPLQDKPPVLTDRQRDRIQQIAHLLPLMYGEVVLPKLEAKGREWVERIRLETMKNDDRTRARQRFRVCVTAQRMTCCLMLCKVCEGLIQKHGLTGAEAQLKQQPGLWKEMLLKAQTPTMLEVYDVIADSLLENALYFFRDRIENAFLSRDYAGNMNGERTKRGKNDSIFERLDIQFSFEQAMQQSVAVKGANVNHNTVRQMLKNWRKQKLVVLEEDGRYRKV